MNKEELIQTLKSQYNKDLRKQLVRSLIDAEKNNDTDVQYKLMNQIFSYVLAQLGWEMSKNVKEWDSTPLDIMIEVFPKIAKSKWFKEQHIKVDEDIDLLLPKDK